jgi:hypothetical protein
MLLARSFLVPRLLRLSHALLMTLLGFVRTAAGLGRRAFARR